MAKTVKTENFPWSIKGISIEARKLAKEGAAKEGLTIGHWLKKIINEDHGESVISANKSLENANPEIAATKTLKSDLSQPPPMKTHDETMVLELIDQIDKLDTSDSLPICHPLENLASYSKTKPKLESITNSTHNNYSPDFKDSYFIVPKVVE